MTRKKLRVGIFSLTSCEGCQVRILASEEILLELLDTLELVHFRLLKEFNEKGPFDVVFVEGSVTTREDEERLKEIREKAPLLIALGTCACFGGVPTMKRFLFPGVAEEAAYKGKAPTGSIAPMRIGQYVPVDFMLRGCPMNPEEFIEAVKNLRLGKPLKDPNFPVCFECRKNAVPCLLNEGRLCLGPITAGGCGAPCPLKNAECIGCRGPHKDAQVAATIEVYKKKGFSKKQILSALTRFAGTSKELLREIRGLW